MPNSTARSFFVPKPNVDLSTATHEDFSDLRTSLLSQGFDIVDFEDGEDVMNVCLEPVRSTILADLTYDQAFELGESVPLFDSVALFEHLRDNDLLSVEAVKAPASTCSEGLSP
jgi:hypothetical protein